MGHTSEARSLARSIADRLEAMSWEELADYGERVEHVEGESGMRYRVRSLVFWDMEPWESDLHISVSVRQRGWNRLLRVREHRSRFGEGLPGS
jgi:hypothetical protein